MKATTNREHDPYTKAYDIDYISQDMDGVYSPESDETEGERLAYLSISEKIPNYEVMRRGLAKSIDKAIAQARAEGAKEEIERILPARNKG